MDATSINFTKDDSFLSHRPNNKHDISLISDISEIEANVQSVTKLPPRPSLIILPSQSKTTYYQTEIINGLVLAFLIVPQSIAYSFIGHFEPTVGIHTAWILGLIAAVFGGRPAMICGISGGYASMLANYIALPPNKSVSGAGVELVFLSALTAGLVLLLAGALDIGRFSNLIPSTVKIGFCNGLAIIIAKGQIGSFKDNKGEYLQGSTLGIVIFYAILCAVIMEFVPRIPFKIMRKIPVPLLSLLIAIMLEFLLFRNIGYSSTTIGDLTKITSENAYPNLFFLDPRYDMTKLEGPDVFLTVLTQGVSLGALVVMETLMTMEVVNDFTKSEGNSRKQFCSMGVGNIFCGLLGASGGSSMIGVTTVNCVGGSKGRISSILAAFATMVIILGAYPLLSFIPMGALIGMMIIVVYRTFKWFTLASFLACFLGNRIRNYFNFQVKIERTDLLVIVVVTLLTVTTNLLVSCLVGICLSTLVFSNKNSKKMKVISRIVHLKKENYEKTKCVKIYTVSGPVFFGTKNEFVKQFDIIHDPEQIRVEFEDDSFFDFTVIEALNVLALRYKEMKKTFKVKKLKESLQLVEKAFKLVKNIEFVTGEEILIPNLPQPITFAGGISVKDIYKDNEHKEAEDIYIGSQKKGCEMARNSIDVGLQNV